MKITHTQNDTPLDFQQPLSQSLDGSLLDLILRTKAVFSRQPAGSTRMHHIGFRVPPKLIGPTTCSYMLCLSRVTTNSSGFPYKMQEWLMLMHDTTELNLIAELGWSSKRDRMITSLLVRSIAYPNWGGSPSFNIFQLVIVSLSSYPMIWVRHRSL